VVVEYEADEPAVDVPAAVWPLAGVAGAVLPGRPSVLATSAGPQNGWLAPGRISCGAVELQSPPAMFPTGVT
jgi:hypothetical protein